MKANVSKILKVIDKAKYVTWIGPTFIINGRRVRGGKIKIPRKWKRPLPDGGEKKKEEQ